MRINIYAEELTNRLEIIEKTADTGHKFVGARFYLLTPESMTPPQHIDDDTSAVTFWMPEGEEWRIEEMFRFMANKIAGIPFSSSTLPPAVWQHRVSGVRRSVKVAP